MMSATQALHELEMKLPERRYDDTVREAFETLWQMVNDPVKAMYESAFALDQEGHDAQDL